LWSNKQEAAKEGKPATDDSPKILTLLEGDLQQIEIHRREGDVTTVLKKDAAGKWAITAPKAYAADQSAVQMLASASTNLKADRVLDENATDLASYGLEPAVLSVAFTDKAGKTTKLLIGESTPTENNVYAKLDGDRRLFTMLSVHRMEFDKSSKDLREKHLLSVEQDQITKMELDREGPDDRVRPRRRQLADPEAEASARGWIAGGRDHAQREGRAAGAGCVRSRRS